MVGVLLAELAWIFFLGSSCTIWAVSAIRHRQHPVTRAELVAGVLLIGGLALMFISLGMVMGAPFVEPDSTSMRVIDLAMPVLGVGLILLGICAAWWMPRDNHGYVEKYRGAPQLPTLRRFIATIGVALGVFLVSAGVLFMFIMSLPWTSPALIVLGAVSGAGAVVGIGAAFGAGIVQYRAGAWKQRQQGG
jgi:hypothetical protein